MSPHVSPSLPISPRRFENHRTAAAHETHLIAKIFVFFFIDCFLWFFLLAFFQIPFGSQIDGLLHKARSREITREITGLLHKAR